MNTTTDNNPSVFAPAKSKFDIDLEYGNMGEQMVAEVLLKSKLESKRDRKARQTGNIAVEFESRGKPAGLATTDADWWVFIIEDESNHPLMLFIHVGNLKEICRTIYELRGWNYGGDDNTSKMVLVKLKELLAVQT
jgi:hypothetical protein